MAQPRFLKGWRFNLRTVGHSNGRVARCHDPQPVWMCLFELFSNSLVIV